LHVHDARRTSIGSARRARGRRLLPRIAGGIHSGRRIDAGATVTWANMDDEPHTVVSDTGLFRSGALDTKESFSFKFDKPGTYHFTCSIHPAMVGTIVVQ
jgi:hypothetical protein